MKASPSAYSATANPPSNGAPEQRLIRVCKVWLIDSGGTSTRVYSHGASWGPTERWANYSSDKRSAVGIIAEMPVEVRELDAPFEFKDLPLP